VLQLEPELTEEPLLEETAKVLNSFDTFSLLQEGQATRSFAALTSTSKTERQSLQEYSYMGISILLRSA